MSDAIERGAAVLRTTGPSCSPVFVAPGRMMLNDVLTAAQFGLLGRVPEQGEHCMFYWENQWGATHGTYLMYWMRLTEVHFYRWADVINKLRGHGQ
jgi:hypothetical protein